MTDFVGDNDHGDTLPPAEVLFKEVLEFRKQRDEARRLYCNTMSNVTATYVVHLRKTPEQIAKMRTAGRLAAEVSVGPRDH